MFHTNKVGVRIDRLFMAVEMLREIAERPDLRPHFDLGEWVTDVNAEMTAYPDEAVVKGFQEDGCLIVAPQECGFAACVCGWMGSLREFNRQGFCLVSNSGRDAIIPTYHTRKARYANWLAVEAFFGLGSNDAENLFSSSAYENRDDAKDPLAVAARIEAYIESQVA